MVKLSLKIVAADAVVETAMTTVVTSEAHVRNRLMSLPLLFRAFCRCKTAAPPTPLAKSTGELFAANAAFAHR